MLYFRKKKVYSKVFSISNVPSIAVRGGSILNSLGLRKEISPPCQQGRCVRGLRLGWAATFDGTRPHMLPALALLLFEVTFFRHMGMRIVTGGSFTCNLTVLATIKI